MTDFGNTFLTAPLDDGILEAVGWLHLLLGVLIGVALGRLFALRHEMVAPAAPAPPAPAVPTDEERDAQTATAILPPEMGVRLQCNFQEQRAAIVRACAEARREGWQRAKGGPERLRAALQEAQQSLAMVLTTDQLLAVEARIDAALRATEAP